MRLADAAKRSLRCGVLCEVAADETCTVRAFSFDEARIQCIDPDLFGAELLGKRTSDGVDRSLGCAIDRSVCETGRDDRANVDNASARGIEALDCGLRREEQAKDVQVELFVEVLRSDLLERAELINAGVVDQNVDGAELLGYGLDEGTDRVGVG